MSVIRLHTLPPVPKNELDRQAVGTAIVILHGEGRYYEAMDILCRVVGWPPLVKGFSTPEERDAWLAKVRGVPTKTETPPERTRRDGKTKKCEACKRYYDPNKILQRHFSNVCETCGRHFNENGKGRAR